MWQQQEWYGLVPMMCRAVTWLLEGGRGRGLIGVSQTQTVSTRKWKEASTPIPTPQGCVPYRVSRPFSHVQTSIRPSLYPPKRVCARPFIHAFTEHVLSTLLELRIRE